VLEAAVEGLTEELSQLLQSFGRAGNIDSDTCSNILSGLIYKSLNIDKQGTVHTRHSAASTRNSFDHSTRNIFDQGALQLRHSVASTRSSFDHSNTRNSADVSLYGYATSRDAAFQRRCSASSTRSFEDNLSRASMVITQQTQASVHGKPGTPRDGEVQNLSQNQDEILHRPISDGFVQLRPGLCGDAFVRPKPGYEDSKPGYEDSKPGYEDSKPGYDESKTSFVQRMREEVLILETTLHDWEDADALMKGLGGEILQLEMRMARMRK
jgi:hypothetical protein